MCMRNGDVRAEIALPVDQFVQLMPMPRLARLDAPGIVHHVIGRGLERKKIFFIDTDRSDFIDRLTDLAEEGAMELHEMISRVEFYEVTMGQ